MNRPGHENTKFFLGREVERTPAHGLQTLFVVGVQDTQDISKHLQGCEHIFFGANHSYNPQGHDHRAWEDMILYFLKKGYLCSLDIPLNQVEQFNDSGMNEFDNFIPQIRIPVPYIRLWNYNTMIKIDDRDFDSTNPGVWCHSLHDLMARDKFTGWREYQEDKTLS